MPWVLDVRDLWPKAAVVLGELTGERAIAAAERLERWLYRKADMTTTVTEPFRRHIADLSPPDSRIEVLLNGTTREWLERGDRSPDRRSLGLPDDRFIWAYAGNLGLYHGLDTAMDAAELLGDGFQLLLIGHGPLRDELERRAAELPAGSVRLEGLMSPDDAGAHLRAADALLVALRASLTDVISSKLFDYCAMRRPVIVAADGETRRLAEGAALIAPPENPQALADAVRTLREDPELAGKLAERAGDLARKHLREVQAERLVDLLEGVSSRGPDEPALSRRFPATPKAEVARLNSRCRRVCATAPGAEKYLVGRARRCPRDGQPSEPFRSRPGAATDRHRQAIRDPGP